MSDQVDPPIVDSWTRTCSNTIKYSHKWTIDNFSLQCQKARGELLQISSSTFSFVAHDQIKWKLHLFLNHSNSDFIGIRLGLLPSNVSDVTAIFTIYLIDVNGTKTYPQKTSYTFEPNSWWGFRDFFKKKFVCENQDVLLPDDKLTIFCEIIILNDVVNISGQREANQVEMFKPRLNDDLGLLFETHDFSDVTLAVTGKDILAHKAVLAARSSVFSAMFKHDMKEQRLNRVKIDDIDHEVFMEMLRFIYTEKAPNLEKMAKRLLAAADKYNLERLKAMCAEALYRSLNTKNALDILVLSYLHNAVWLKTVVTNFVCEYTTDIMNTDAFESIPHEYPDLMVEILRAIKKRKNGLERLTVDRSITRWYKFAQWVWYFFGIVAKSLLPLALLWLGYSYYANISLGFGGEPVVEPQVKVEKWRECSMLMRWADSLLPIFCSDNYS